MKNRTNKQETQASPEILTVDELLAELTLLTSTETIPPSQLLTIIAKSHVALTAQFVAFQNQQAAENHELRQAMKMLTDNLERRLEPQSITRNLLTHNRWPALVLFLVLPLATILTIGITHIDAIYAAWLSFIKNPASFYITLIIVTIPLTTLIFILIRNIIRNP